MPKYEIVRVVTEEVVYRATVEAADRTHADLAAQGLIKDAHGKCVDWGCGELSEVIAAHVESITAEETPA
jgi:hypothetical protein